MSIGGWRAHPCPGHRPPPPLHPRRHRSQWPLLFLPAHRGCYLSSQGLRRPRPPRPLQRRVRLSRGPIRLRLPPDLHAVPTLDLPVDLEFSDSHSLPRLRTSLDLPLASSPSRLAVPPSGPALGVPALLTPTVPSDSPASSSNFC